MVGRNLGGGAARPLSFRLRLGAARAQIRLSRPGRRRRGPDLSPHGQAGIWGDLIRLRFADTFGTKPVTLDDVHVGLQSLDGNLAHGTNKLVRFKQQQGVVLAPGETVYSDGIKLPFVK